jgi:hypothetical protein
MRLHPLFNWLRAIGLALLLAATGGCRTGPPSVTPVGDPSVALRNNAASLLYDLLGDERNVNKLLLIKRESPELRGLITTIASVCAGAQNRLDREAQSDPTLSLKSTDLPPGEDAMRKAESKARASLLLRSGGADFEFHLLFSQAQALGYAEQLALVASRDKSVPGTAEALANISEQMKILHQQVIAMLREPRTASSR